jgi:Glutathione S-transferase, N-terminal domain
LLAACDADGLSAEGIAMKLFEFPPTRSIRARWTLQELGVEFEALTVDLIADEHRSPRSPSLSTWAKNTRTEG